MGCPSAFVVVLKGEEQVVKPAWSEEPDYARVRWSQSVFVYINMHRAGALPVATVKEISCTC
jgi:hypothetical protein